VTNGNKSVFDKEKDVNLEPMALAGRTALQPNGAGPEGLMAVTGATSRSSRTPRTRSRFGRIAQIAAVIAVALMLFGMMASSADARRSQAVSGVNSAVGLCFGGGGNPYIYEAPDYFYFRCDWEDGTNVEIEFGWSIND
jgi:hypothetical protein